MPLRIKVRGTGELRQKLLAFSSDLKRSSESLLAQEARALCVAYGAVTQPGGFEEGKMWQWRNTVERQIRKVFTNRDSIPAVAAVIYRTNPALAHAYYRAATNGKLRQAQKYLRQAGVRIGSADPALHRAARTAPKGYVPRNQIPVAVVKAPSLNAYVRRKRDEAGIAQAGWYAAAKALGGRVRRNLTDSATGRRSTEEIFPASIRKIAKRFPSLGSATVQPNRITIWTNVRHARGAMSKAEQSHAEEIARETLLKALQNSLNVLAKKHFRRVS